MFATLKHISSFKRVHYYSIVLKGSDSSLFETFLDAYLESSMAEEARMILFWLQEIGNNRGAKSRYFRHEGSAVALPPPSSIIQVADSSLRLYCSVVSESHVILFGGGIKTKKVAQQCPNVKPHFEMANKLSGEITKAIVEKMLIIPEEHNVLLIENDLEIYI